MTLPALGVFGISGVGKTTLIRQYVEQRPRIVAISAGRILQDRKGQSGETLRQGAATNVHDTQAGLIEGFAEFRAASQSIGVIFDGHTVIDSDKGLIDIPADVIAGLMLQAIIFISDKSDDISRRRQADTARTRPNRSPDELAQHQSRALALAVQYANSMRIPVAHVTAGDIKQFKVAADTAFGIH